MQQTTKYILYYVNCNNCHNTDQCDRLYPIAILFITPLEITHPAAKRLQSVRYQFLPNGRNVTIKEGSSYIIQLTTHAHLTSQGLQDTRESKKKNPSRVEQKDNACFSQHILVIYPNLTLLNSAKDCCMRTTSLLKRSSSWSRTTEVGEMLVPNSFRITSMSNNSGSLFWMSWATWLMCSSLLMLPPDSSEGINVCVNANEKMHCNITVKATLHKGAICIFKIGWILSVILFSDSKLKGGVTKQNLFL